MKYLQTYNESIRDKMLGKTPEEVQKALRKKTEYRIILYSILSYGFDVFLDMREGGSRNDLFFELWTNILNDIFNSINVPKEFMDVLKSFLGCIDWWEQGGLREDQPNAAKAIKKYSYQLDNMLDNSMKEKLKELLKEVDHNGMYKETYE